MFGFNKKIDKLSDEINRLNVVITHMKADIQALKGYDNTKDAKLCDEYKKKQSSPNYKSYSTNYTSYSPSSRTESNSVDDMITVAAIISSSDNSSGGSSHSSSNHSYSHSSSHDSYSSSDGGSYD